MSHLIIHSDYHAITVGLYHHDTSAFYTLDKKQASAQLINTVHAILREHAVKLEDLEFIGAHAGPAPFTTLRTALATVNGISFATKIPLVSVNGLDAFCMQNQEFTLVLNAFCEDIYFGYYDTTSATIKKGCTHIDEFLAQDLSIFPQTFVGNGTQLFENKIRATHGYALHIPAEYPLEISIEQVADRARALWHDKITVTQIVPEYMKQYSAKMG